VCSRAGLVKLKAPLEEREAGEPEQKRRDRINHCSNCSFAFWYEETDSHITQRSILLSVLTAHNHDLLESFAAKAAWGPTRDGARVKPTARATSIIIAQASRIIEYTVEPLLTEENISELFALWTEGAAADPLATPACELDDEPDEAAPATASDCPPEATPDGASGDRAPGERSHDGGAPSGDAAPDEPQPGALPPRASGASDGGAPALPADGCVQALAPPYAARMCASAMRTRHTPLPRSS
jgi:hypothetical protein